MEQFAWIGPVGDHGGYGAVARNYLRGLAEAGAAPVVQPITPIREGLADRDQALLSSLPGRATGRETAVVHADPPSLPGLIARARASFAGPVVACTLGETDRIPPGWADACNLADEVWVPSQFNMLTFARSGVDEARLRLVPYGLDVDNWSPDGPASPHLPGDAFTFLYAFGFDWRKGFDVLLAAYLREFGRDEPVRLALKVYDPPFQRRQLPVRARLAQSVAPFVDLLAGDLPPVVVLDEHIAQADLAALYRTADVYVSTERASGWGMPCMEMMACGGAAAAVDWGGATEFMEPANALLLAPGPLVPVDERLSAERPDYAGQRWPDLPVEAVQALLRDAYECRRELGAMAARGRDEIRMDWTAARSADWILRRNSAPYRSRPGLRERLRPLVGLEPASPLQGARESVLLTAYGTSSNWRAALDAHVAAFADSDPVTLCLLAPDGVDAEVMAREVVAHLEATGQDPARVPDTLLLTGGAAEALADPRVVGVIAPGDAWPATSPRIAAAPAALRNAVGH